MIRDFHSDPLPQGCPFSFIAILKKNNSTKESTEALLGAQRFQSCTGTDLSARQIRDWFAFDLDQKTSGLWGYFNYLYNFKVTAGGKQTGTDGTVTGKDQSLIELWDNVHYYGLNLYSKTENDKPMSGYYVYSAGFADAYTSVIQADDSGFWGFSASNFHYKLTAAKTQTLWQIWSQTIGFYYATYVKNDRAGFYQVSSGDADFFGGFTKSGEASIWGYTSGQWEFKMKADLNYVNYEVYSSNQKTAKGYARMYAYDTAAGFSCSKTDNVSSTLEPSTLWCIDKTNKRNSNLYAGGLWIGQNSDSRYCFIDGYLIEVKDKNTEADGKLYPGWMGVKKQNRSFCYIDGSYIWVGGNGSADAKVYPGEIWAKTENGGQFSAVGGTMTLSYNLSAKGTYEPGAITLKSGGTVSIDASAIGSKTAYFRQVTVCENGTSKTAYFLMTDPV